MGEPKLSHLRALWACFGCMSSIYLITIGGVCPPYLITIVGDLNSTLENHPGAIPNGIFISLLYNRQGYCVRTFSYSYSLNSNCSHEMIKTELTKSNVRWAFNLKRDYLGILNLKYLFSSQAPWPFMVNYLHICHLISRHKIHSMISIVKSAIDTSRSNPLLTQSRHGEIKRPFEESSQIIP